MITLSPVYNCSPPLIRPFTDPNQKKCFPNNGSHRYGITRRTRPFLTVPNWVSPMLGPEKHEIPFQ